MKKLFILFALAISIGAITSCDANVDVLKGTWLAAASPSTGMADELNMRYIFDGKGNYTFIVAQENMPGSKSTGTYVLDGNKVRTYYTIQNADGKSQERTDVLTLDPTHNPPSLSAPLFTSDGTQLGELVFYKQ